MMNMKHIREIAKQQGITPGRQTKIELVRMLQSAEGNFDCFAKAYAGYCDQSNCSWRVDCFPLSMQSEGNG